LIGFTELPLQLFSFFGKFNELTAFKTKVYLNAASQELSKSQLSLAGLIKRILFLILFLYTRAKILPNYKHYNFFLNGYILSIALYFLFSRSLLVMISRGSFYFNIMETILLSYQLTVFKKPSNKLIISVLLCILAVILFFQSIAAYPDLFIPYKGIWINTSFHREVF
ncbi:MAG: EpsG family protein, partial [Tenuifilum sp.]|uniref:EpsG family protein n=1 Tax=Tenuifilum sp. TaxID=2760880 RepID=UPI0030AE25D0